MATGIDDSELRLAFDSAIRPALADLEMQRYAALMRFTVEAILSVSATENPELVAAMRFVTTASRSPQHMIPKHLESREPPALRSARRARHEGLGCNQYRLSRL